MPEIRWALPGIKMRWIIYIILILVLASCTKDDDGFTVFVVPAHRETSQIPERAFLPGWNKNSLDFWFKTNDTWLWTDEGAYHSHPGWAKITGLSNGPNHREDSYRLGYKSDYGYMVVGLFVERGSQYLSAVLDTIQMDAMYHCRLSIEDGYYVARMNGKEVKIECRKDKRGTYRCYPCMAGGYDLNHDWVVPIKYD